MTCLLPGCFQESAGVRYNDYMKKINTSRMTDEYETRILNEEDADDVLAIMQGNPRFYEYTTVTADKESVLEDMKALPEGKTAEDKYYFGFFDQGKLFAVMDLIDGYPDEDTAFIGFFMMDAIRQGRGTGRKLVKGVLDHLREAGFSRVRLCINKGNPQSSHFWHRIGFKDIREAKRGEETVIIADYQLGEEDE